VLILREPDHERRRLSSALADWDGDVVILGLNDIDSVVVNDDMDESIMQIKRRLYCTDAIDARDLRCVRRELLLSNELAAETR
jgi:hypothetical protein